MKILVTGACGQLGYSVVNNAASRGHECIGCDIMEQDFGICGDEELSCAAYVKLDITDSEAVKSIIAALKPDAIIHCAAWTDVDAAECEGNKEKVNLVNHLGTGFIAEAAKDIDAKMLYVSTDYVFNGQGDRPWDPDDKAFAPLNIYGKTKLYGEEAVAGVLNKFFIVRTSWLFGLYGKNFIKTIINTGKTHDTVRVVNDQIGTPTYAYDLSRLLVDMVETEKYGYYHAANEGDYISWYDLCVECYNQYGLKTKIIPVSTKDYGLSETDRPHNSRLDRSKLALCGFKPLPVWQDAVRRYLKEAAL